jgi:hypothetical protein
VSLPVEYEREIPDFPYAAPETLLARIRRLEAIVLAIGPDLTAKHCLLMLGDLSLTTMRFEDVASAIRATALYQERAEILPAPPRPPTIDDRLPFHVVRRWRRPRNPGWQRDARNSS